MVLRKKSSSMKICSFIFSLAPFLPILPVIASAAPPLGSLNLDGIYLGIPIGLNYVDVKATYGDRNGKGRVVAQKYGALSGVFGGYLKELGATRTLIGVETSTLISSVSFSKPFGGTGGAYGQMKVMRRMSVGASAIVGKLFNPRTFLFGELGGETMRYDVKFHYNNDGGTPAFFRGQAKTVNGDYFGLLVGVGFDYLILPGIAIGAKYNYLGMLKNKRITIDATAPDAPVFHLKPKDHKIIARLTYRLP